MSHVLQQRRPEARDESMDLFAQAMAGKGGKESMGGSQQGDAAEKAEAERIRRLNESAEREEKEQRQKSARFNTGVLIASLTGMYIYMGKKESIVNEDSWILIGVLKALNPLRIPPRKTRRFSRRTIDESLQNSLESIM